MSATNINKRATMLAFVGIAPFIPDKFLKMRGKGVEWAFYIKRPGLCSLFVD